MTPGSRLDPFSVAGQDAMLAVLADARREEPVFFSPVLGAWVVTRAADVEAALEAPDVFGSLGALPEPTSPQVLARLADRVPAGATLIGWDAPEHTRMRRVLQAAFTAPRMRALEASFRTRVTQRLDELAGRAEVDLLTDLALPVTLAIVLELIGVPVEDRQQVFAWSTDWGRLHGADAEGLGVDEQLRLADSAIALHDLVGRLIAERRAAPRDDLISQVVSMEAESEEPLVPRELLALFPGLIFAGHENSAHLGVNALARLLPRDDRRELVEQGQRLARFVDEVARLDAPFAGAVRTVTRGVDLGGHTFGSGDRVFLHYVSANRDETRFPEPDVLDLERAHPRRHFAFGAGVHACIGAALGRMEAAAMCQLVVERWPDIRLAETPRRAPHYFMRGYDHLVVAPGRGTSGTADAGGSPAPDPAPDVCGRH